MASRASTATARVAFDPKSFEDGAKAVMNAANAMSATVTAAFAAAGVAVLAAFGAKTISGLVDTLKEVILFGEQMANAGKKAGLAAGQYYLFNSALEKGIGLKTAAALLGENADVLNRSANVFRDVSIKLWAVGEKIRGFWLGLMDRVAPVLSKLLDGTLGYELVSAGQMFGDKLAEAVAIVYQLAQDGNLWTATKDGFKLAFDYAGERMLWLGGVGYGILQEVFSQAFVDGINGGLAKSWDSMKTVSSSWQDTLATSFFNIWTNIEELVNNMLHSIDQAAERLHLIPKGSADRIDAHRKQGIAERDLVGKQQAPVAPEGSGSFVDTLKSIFAKNQFTPSEDLANQIDGFGKTLTETFSKYQSNALDAPAKTYENNTRRAAFGADSLASIGGGGNVYLGLSVLDVNKAQLRVLESIDGKLGGRGPGESAFATSGGDLQPTSISRSQTSTPLTTY